MIDSTPLNFFSAYCHALDVCYSGLQLLFAYDFSGKMFDACFWLKDNEYTLASELVWLCAETAAGFGLFISMFLDDISKLNLFPNGNSEVFFKNYKNAFNPSLFLLYHPEIYIVRRAEYASSLDWFGTELYCTILDGLNSYSLVLPLMLGFQAFALVFLATLFIGVFASFFASTTKEEGASDYEFTIVNLSTEAEKELFSVEDAKYVVAAFAMLFGSYFGFMAFSAGSVGTLSMWAVTFVPFIGIGVLTIPGNLLFDFGLLFLLYLRGSSNTNSFFFELFYDYIGIIAFFTRLVVQFVRMVLMAVVYAMMHDTIVLQKVAHCFLPVGDSFYEELMGVRFNANSVSYFLIVTFPCRLFYWLYEVVHTFFVVTAQFAAFFTIAFWLFLLFYTFYLYEKFEYHFKSLRLTRRLMEEEFWEYNAARKKQNK